MIIPRPDVPIIDKPGTVNARWWDYLKGDGKFARILNDARALNPTTFSITAITKANPCVMTIPDHTMIAGDFYFVRGVVGMTQVNFRWFVVASVAGDNVTVDDAGAAAGLLVDLGALNSTGFSTYTSGGIVLPQSTRGTFTWPDHVDFLHVHVWGSGGAGGSASVAAVGANSQQLGGAGGSGAKARGLIPRPSNGMSLYIVDRGMPGIQANVTNNTFLFAGITAFGTWTLTVAGPVPVYVGDLWAHGAGVGQPAAGANVGGDGGTPGIAGGDLSYDTFNGGQGGASPPAILDGGAVRFNASFPKGADGADGGGYGGNNGQDGQGPGGGGAPGYVNVTVDPAFDCTASACPLTGGREIGQSGAGGLGKIRCEW